MGRPETADAGRTTLAGPGPKGESPTSSEARHYRSQVEVLRDLVEAAREECRKTRIIGRANLNEESFARYSGLAVAEGLLGRTAAGYRTTSQGERWLGAVHRVFVKRAELLEAVRQLARVTDGPVAPEAGDGPAVPAVDPPPDWRSAVLRPVPNRRPVGDGPFRAGYGGALAAPTARATAHLPARPEPGLPAPEIARLPPIRLGAPTRPDEPAARSARSASRRGTASALSTLPFISGLASFVASVGAWAMGVPGALPGGS